MSMIPYPKKPLHRFEVRVYGASGIVIDVKQYSARSLRGVFAQYERDSEMKQPGPGGSVKFIRPTTTGEYY